MVFLSILAHTVHLPLRGLLGDYGPPTRRVLFTPADPGHFQPVVYTRPKPPLTAKAITTWSTCCVSAKPRWKSSAASLCCATVMRLL